MLLIQFNLSPSGKTMRVSVQVAMRLEPVTEFVK